MLLGTANFGLPYGFAARRKQLSFEQSRELVERALRLGYGGLDTAAAYGNAEEMIGKIPSPESTVFDTKIHSLQEATGTEIAKQVERAKRHLGRTPRVVYFHSPKLAWSVSSEELKASLEILSETEPRPILGVSVNDFLEVEHFLEKRPEFKAFQLPCNLLTRGLIDRQKLREMKSIGILIAVRSLFAQGILLLPKSRLLSAPLSDAEMHSILELRRACEQQNIGVAELSVHYFLHELGVDVVAGAHRPTELVNLRSLKELKPDFGTLPSLSTNSLDMRQRRFES